ncbi:hypothetical protein NM688_g929 [Phlebia brevispora]|uniref:Uncharacterized protein n=1 Tax=Phlebia brevispora TaxID=194682 RepID=A0ACC1TCY2_9APHY|nr:hypothetical protein NM688_g929 [Phlebia brevispora]
MNQSRWLSTTVSRAAQPLYPEFVRPLNGEQKKALRKATRKTEPHVNRCATEHMQNSLARFATPTSQQQERKQLHEQLRNVIRNKFGDGYDVQDVGAHAYARDLSVNPFEFAIVDLKRPSGLSRVDLEDIQAVKMNRPMVLPEAYNPTSVGAALQKEGFNGYFEDQFGPPMTVPVAEMMDYQSWMDSHTPWPLYTTGYPPRRTILYPVKLQAHSPSRFSLMTANPVTPLLVRLLKTYVQGVNGLETLIGGIHLWARSYYFPGLSPTSLALMAIRTLQISKNLSSLQKPTAGAVLSLFKTAYPYGESRPFVSMPQLFYVPGARRWVMDIFKVDAAFVEPPSAMTIKPARSFCEFLGHWGALGDGMKHIESIRESRTFRVPRRHFDPIRARHNPIRPAEEESHDLISMYPQNIAIQDPFVFTYSHTGQCPRYFMDAFRRECASGYNIMGRRGSFNMVLGGHLPNTLTSTVSRSYETGHTYGTRLRERENSADLSQTAFGLRTRSFHTSAIRTGALSKKKLELSMAPTEVIKERRRIVDEVQTAIQKRFGPKYRVYVFGSALYGMDSATSDLDLVVFDPAHPQGWVNGVKGFPPPIYNLNRLAAALRNQFSNVVVVRANVPIIKFTDRKSKIACDLNVNERLGNLNSQMIREYCILSPLLREVAICIKRWAKGIGMNNPAGQGGATTFSSYALTIMTIALFQSRGMLPNLQSDLPPLQNSETQVFWTCTTKKAHRTDYVKCDVRFKRNLDQWTPAQVMDLKDALLMWFRFYGYEHDYGNDLVNIREGGILSRPQVPPVPQEPEDEDKDKVELAEQDVGEDEEGPLIFLKTQSDAQTTAAPAALSSTISKDVEESSENDTVCPSGNSASSEEQLHDVLDDAGPEEFDAPWEFDPAVLWRKYNFVVVDPFIISKNLAKSICTRQIREFQAECRKMADHLSAGGAFDELLLRKQPSKKKKKITRPKSIPTRQRKQQRKREDAKFPEMPDTILDISRSPEVFPTAPMNSIHDGVVVQASHRSKIVGNSYCTTFPTEVLHQGRPCPTLHTQAGSTRLEARAFTVLRMVYRWHAVAFRRNARVVILVAAGSPSNLAEPS